MSDPEDPKANDDAEAAEPADGTAPEAQAPAPDGGSEDSGAGSEEAAEQAYDEALAAEPEEAPAAAPTEAGAALPDALKPDAEEGDAETRSEPRPVMEILGAKEAAPPGPARKKDRLAGLLLVAVTFLGTLCLAWWAKTSTVPTTSRAPEPPTTQGIVGWPNAVDPIKNLAVARQRTERSELRGIVMEHVKSDGTVDTTKLGRVRYSFQSKPGEGPQPPLDAGRLRTPYCGKQWVRIKKEGIQEDEDRAKSRCPSKGLDALPDPPRCSPKQVWDYAVSKGAPKDRTARLEYYMARAGPAWRFHMVGKNRQRFTLYGDCGRELKGAEAVGSVP